MVTKKAETSPVNSGYKELIDQFVNRIPNRFTDKTITTPEDLKALYREKIGKHIVSVLPAPANK